MSMRGDLPKEQKAFYDSSEWQHVRSEYLSKVKGLCERCLTLGICRPAYIVHHKEYISPDNYQDPEVLLCMDNLEALCLDCHNKEHFRKKVKKRFEIAEEGHVIIL